MTLDVPQLRLGPQVDQQRNGPALGDGERQSADANPPTALIEGDGGMQRVGHVEYRPPTVRMGALGRRGKERGRNSKTASRRRHAQPGDHSHALSWKSR